MKVPKITVITVSKDIAADVRKVWIKNINEALLVSRGNIKQLKEWHDFAKELKFWSGKLMDEAQFGNVPEKIILEVI